MELINEILLYAKENSGDVRCYEEDFVADNYAGGNMDDAWQEGFNDGYTALANEILEIIEKYNKEDK